MFGLFAVGYWGWHAGSSWWLRVVLAVGAVLVVAVIWGLFIAPRAPRRLHGPGLLVAELAVLFGAAVLVALAGQVGVAVVFGVLVVVNRLLLRAWGL